MASEELVDPTGEESHPFRRFMIQIAIPIIGVILVVLVIVGVSLHSYNSTREGVLRLSHTILLNQQQRVSKEVADFLEPASTAAFILDDMIHHSPIRYERGLFEIYTTSLLRKIPQFQSFYLADEDGNFAMVEHMSEGRLRRTLLQRDPTTHKMVFYRRIYNQDGVLIGQSSDPSNGYDPRTRPWYKNAGKDGMIQWYKPYYLSYLHEVLIASAASFQGADGKKKVFSVNITLSQLTTFLSSLRFGTHGDAAIIDKDGHFIAGRRLLEVAHQKQKSNAEWDPTDTVVDSQHTPVLMRAYDDFRVNSYGVREIQKDNKRYIMIAAALPSDTQGWILLVVVPENDFSDFTASDGKQNFLFSLVIVGLAIVLAGLLIRQGRRTEKARKDFRTQQYINQQQGQIIGDFARDPTLLNPQEEALKLTEELASLSHSKRVGLWRLLRDGSTLLCDDFYDVQGDTHTGGFEIANAEMSAFFSLIQEGGTVHIEDASRDDRVLPYYRQYMSKFGSTSLDIFIVQGEGSASAGAIVLEDAEIIRNVANTVELVGAIVALRFAVANREMIGYTRKVASQSQPVILAQKEQNLIGEQGVNGQMFPLALQKPHQAGSSQSVPEGEGAELANQGFFPYVAVMMLSFLELNQVSAHSADTIVETVKTMSLQLEEVAQKYNLRYIQVVGNRILAATGFVPEGDSTAIIRLANAALDIRDLCAALLGQLDIDPLFKIGMDIGPAYAGHLGQAGQVFNIWGGVVKVAELMAFDAPDIGTIQVTEVVYENLRHRFLFRPRSTFFVPGSGLVQTYVLAGLR
ncbi:adenylate/guanylate cyclase domain-containing protein [Entomobacter blattae]|uniref:adenylate cyclase n=1 Tax=Entomobacter blattae TaxID=2762277 RepID=A0A7H1NRD2_9PROT|nr:adenylate/guanylate cyclase domain-containing protein [Entomobacter blattae]QNT78342.1 Cache domain protein [Entomobacter blattae]